jgi:hypothetical protein
VYDGESKGPAVYAGPLEQVEMAGIEPASRELDHGYATSLVGLLFLTRFTLDRRSVKRAR